MTRKLVMEAIGTFFLVLTIGQVVLDPGAAGALAPIAIGGVLAVMVYAGGHISGAHYNPAVSLAVWLRGKATAAEFGLYSVAQVAAAIVAAVVVGFLKGGGGIAPGDIPLAPVLVAEIVFTFALAFVVLNVATARGTEGNSYFGLAIGGTLMVAAFAIGPVSGAAINPAVAVGLVLMDLAAPASLAVYLPAHAIGGAAAALVFNALALGADKPTTATPADQAGLRGAGET